MQVATVSANVTSLGTHAYEGVDYLFVGLANAAVAEAAAQSGAKNIVMYTDDLGNKLDLFTGKTISIPSSVAYFELNGENQVLENFSVVSNAQKTVINKMKFANCTHLPLIISSTDTILNQVDVQAKGIGIALTSSNANLALQSNINVTTGSKESMLIKSTTLTASKDDIVGTLSVSGHLNVNGVVSETGHLAKAGSEIVTIDSDTFDALLNSVLVTLDANGGDCDEDYILVLPKSNAQLPVPTREGHVFYGWYLSDGTQLNTSNISSYGKNISAIAKWSPAQYSVTWETEEGSAIEVRRTATNGLNVELGVLSSGDTIYYGDTLEIVYEAVSGYTITETGEDHISVTDDVTSTSIFAKVRRNSYTATWSSGTGYTIAVKRTSSPSGASIGSLSSGATVYYGDVLSVTYTAKKYYKFTEKGDATITVTDDITDSDIYATAALNTKLVKVSDYTVAGVKSHLEIYTLSGEDGTIYVKGWVYDTARPNAQTRIDVNSMYSIEATKPSPSCPVGGNHGYEQICTGFGHRVMIYTWAVGNETPLGLWDTWINYSNATYYNVELAP